MALNAATSCRRIMLLNPKGGCGKSTLATNLAAFYAARGSGTAIVDHDPQGSSMRWLSVRDAQKPRIHGVSPHQQRASQVTQSWLMRMPPGTSRVVVDTPAGVRGPALAQLLRDVDSVVIPVVPSAVDLHAVAQFVDELFAAFRLRGRPVPVALVANRVRAKRQLPELFEPIVERSGFPLVAALRDAPVYLHAAETGVGLHEVEPAARVRRCLSQWRPLVEWLEQHELPLDVRTARAVSSVPLLS